MKLTQKQLIAFAEAFVFANGLRNLARRRIKEKGVLLGVVDIPLSRSFYRRHGQHCRKAILMAFDAFFERAGRGHNELPGRPARASAWRLRVTKTGEELVHLSEDAMKTLRELYEANKEHITAVHQEVFRSDSKTVVQTTFEFPTPQLRELFEKQVLEDRDLVERNGGTMKKGTTHTPEAIEKMVAAKAGKAKSPEHKAKIAAAQKQRWSKLKEALAQMEERS